MSPRSRNQSAPVGLTGVSLFALATVASAQENTTPVTLDTVQVQAERESATGPVEGYTARRSASSTKTDATLVETPQAITVVGREQMDAQQVQSVGEATRYTPGVRAETFGADPRNDWFLLRGFTAQDSGSYLDGLQLPSASFATWRVEPFGLERIDVVRGPSSVLYGGTNPGGLVNLVSKAPPRESVRHVEVGINEFLNGYGAVDVGGLLGSEKWAYRVTALARGGGTQVRNVDNNRLFLAPALTWRPFAGTSLTLHGSYQLDRTRVQNFLPYEGTVVDAPYGRIPTSLYTSDLSLDRFKRDQGMVGYAFEHRFDDTFSVRQNLRYGHLGVDFKSLYGVGYDGPPENARLARGNFVTTPKANLFTVDTQGEARFVTGPVRHTVLVGVDYKHFRLNDEQGYEQGESFNLLAPSTGHYTPTTLRYTVATSRQNQLGVYAQDQLRLAGRLNLVLSGRHDWVGLHLDNTLLPTASYDGRQSAFSGRAGLLYSFDLGLSPYVSYSRSFNPLASVNKDGALFEPERGEQFEAGIKFQPDASRLSLGASVFELRRQNVLVTDGLFNTTQVGEVRSRGVELEANASLTQGLNLVGALSFNPLKISKGLDTELGKTPVATPSLQASLWLDYTVPEGDLRGAGVGAGVRHVGESFADAANTKGVPGFTLVDAGVHYSRANWRAAVNASNVLDTTYVSGCSSTVACFYGDRRRAMLNVGYSF